jgi:predicted RNA-binding Zn ribbon-like protein
MGRRERTAGNLELVGGRLCLDFTNTVSTRIEALRREYLTTYGDLVAWGQHARILTEDGAKALLHKATRRAGRAAAALDRAVALRETVYSIFSMIADGREPRTSDLAALNIVLHEALSRLEVRPSAGGFEWAWALDEDDLAWMRWPIARSAADLLISGDLGRVRRCAREGCDWLFVDSSKNHSRRWCSMAMCGSRVKAHRYYQRRKRGKSSDSAKTRPVTLSGLS